MKNRAITWFAGNLRDYREKHKITQVQLAERMGIPVSTLCRWEATQWPTLGNFAYACRRAGINPMKLIGSFFGDLIVAKERK